MAPVLTAADILIIRLHDGRRIAYVETGAPQGFPVPFLHGTPNSYLTVPQLPPSAGARIIAANRPGYGMSDPSPWGTFQDLAADIGELADVLGLERFAMIGVSGGGPGALACAYYLSDRVKAVALVSASGPPQGPVEPDAEASLRGQLLVLGAELESRATAIKADIPGTLRQMAVHAGPEAKAHLEKVWDQYLLSVADAMTHGAAGWFGDVVSELVDAALTGT